MREIEKLILSNVNKKYKYLARDKNGELYLFSARPKKDLEEERWDAECEFISLSMYSHLFSWIGWDDKEAYKIEKELEYETQIQQ